MDTQSSQTTLFTGGSSISPSKTGHRTGSEPILPRFLQPILFGPKTKQQVASYFGSQCLEPIFAGQDIQNGNSRIHKVVSSARGVGHIIRF